MSRAFLMASAAVASMVLVAQPALAIKGNGNAGSPASGINLEQTRTSNAGAGNGGEFNSEGTVAVETTVYEVVTVETSDPYDVVTGEGTLPTVVDVGAWSVSQDLGPVGNSGNHKYLLERTVTTTTGTYVETTTFVDKTTTTATYEDTTTTTTYDDVDPGRSGDHNNAPEVDSHQEVEVTTNEIDREVSGPTQEQAGEPSVSESTSTATTTETTNFVDNKPHDIGDVVDAN